MYNYIYIYTLHHLFVLLPCSFCCTFSYGCLAPQPSCYSTRRRSSTTYKNYLIAAFRQFLVFIIVMRLELPCTSKTIITYLEFLVQNSLRVTSLLEWPTYVFSTRKVLLFIKSVQNNVALSIRITRVFLVPMLHKMIRAIQKYANAKLHTTLFLTAFLASIGWLPCFLILLVSLIKLGIPFRMI